VPILNCVTDNGDSTITVFFGYRNDNAYDVPIAVGVNNRFFPLPFDRSQPTLFLPGQHDSAFNVTFNVEEIGLIWWLDGNITAAWSGSPACP